MKSRNFKMNTFMWNIEGESLLIAITPEFFLFHRFLHLQLPFLIISAKH